MKKRENDNNDEMPSEEKVKDPEIEPIVEEKSSGKKHYRRAKEKKNKSDEKDNEKGEESDVTTEFKGIQVKEENNKDIENVEQNDEKRNHRR